MRPVKSLVPLAKWFLRIAVAAIIYSEYLNRATSFSFSGLGYFMALIFVILGVLLIVGGLMKTAKLTVVSGLLIWVACIIQLLGVDSFTLINAMSILPLASIGFYFMARGNIG